MKEKILELLYKYTVDITYTSDYEYGIREESYKALAEELDVLKRTENKTEIKVKSCRECPLRKSDADGMYCSHPYWNDKGAYSNMIITQDSLNSYPVKCPLRLGDLTKYQSISLLKTIK